MNIKIKLNQKPITSRNLLSKSEIEPIRIFDVKKAKSRNRVQHVKTEKSYC